MFSKGLLSGGRERKAIENDPSGTDRVHEFSIAINCVGCGASMGTRMVTGHPGDAISNKNDICNDCRGLDNIGK